MNPFFFGDSRSPLFGVYHPPDPTGKQKGVVLCYPVGGEYLRAHRAFRQLSNLLVRAGMHVLRFDYAGTGDSFGDPADASLEEWMENVQMAVEELRESAGLEKVSLAGLRLGANLALGAARSRSDVERVVMWDPIPDGAEYLDALEKVEVGAVRDGVTAYPPDTVGSGGFAYTPQLQEEIRGVRLGEDSPPAGLSVEMISSREHRSLRKLSHGWSSGGASAQYRCIPSEGDWAKGDRFGSALIPGRIIQGVVDGLVGKGRSD